MGAALARPKPANAGRKKGTKALPRHEIMAAIRAKYPDFHPVVEMAAMAMDPDLSYSNKLACLREVARYCVPIPKPAAEDASSVADTAPVYMVQTDTVAGPSSADEKKAANP